MRFIIMLLFVLLSSILINCLVRTNAMTSVESWISSCCVGGIVYAFVILAEKKK